MKTKIFSLLLFLALPLWANAQEAEATPPGAMIVVTTEDWWCPQGVDVDAESIDAKCHKFTTTLRAVVSTEVESRLSGAGWRIYPAFVKGYGNILVITYISPPR